MAHDTCKFVGGRLRPGSACGFVGSVQRDVLFARFSTWVFARNDRVLDRRLRAADFRNRRKLVRVLGNPASRYVQWTMHVPCELHAMWEQLLYSRSLL